MLPEYRVEPHRGVGPVDLGMSRAEVHRLMGEPPSSFRKGMAPGTLVDGWHQNGFQVFYSDDEKVDFIELHRDTVRALLFDRVVFETPVRELLEAIAERGAPHPGDPEYGYTFTYRELDLGLWRKDMFGELDTVAVGARGYYSREL